MDFKISFDAMIAFILKFICARRPLMIKPPKMPCLSKYHQNQSSSVRIPSLFDSENELVHSFLLLVGNKRRSPFAAPLVAREFNYLNGKIDVIALGKDRRVFGFEAKLTRWKEALHQAYRNAAFCHFSYVLLPSEVSNRALSASDSFFQRGVGLCSLANGHIEIKIRAPLNKPLQPWLTRSAQEFILNGSNARETGI